MTNKTSILLGTLIVLLAARDADADCEKWNSGASICETNPTTCASNAPPPTFGQWRHFFARLYTDGRLQACRNHYDYLDTTYKGRLVKAIDLGPVTTGCQLDANGNNKIDVSEQYNHSVLYMEVVPREEMCSRTPNGPYAFLDPSNAGVPGGYFTDQQREDVLDENWAAHNSNLVSNVFELLPRLEHELLGTPVEPYLSLEDDMYIIYSLLPAPPTDQPNIDHIIPRKDVYGCDCGPSSYANTLVISASLNRAMSNNSQHAARQAILREYTLP